MSDPQGPVPGALDPHHPYSFIPSTSKHYTNGISSSDLTNPHVIIKNTNPWLPPGEDHHPRLSDTFSEMRYLELNNWDLNNYNEGLTARLVDSRSLDSTDTQINYRPWEKPDSSTTPQPPSTPTSNGQIKHENGVSSTNSPEKASPPTLTPLTNAFPTFTDTFQPQKLPSFQSQFNAFTDPPHHVDPPVSAPPQTPPSLPSFHTLPATRYPPNHPPPPANLPPTMVPAVLQHRPPEPFIEDRQIHLFPATVHHPLPPQFPAIITQNGQPHNPATYHVQMNGTPTYTQVTLPSTSQPQTLNLQELVPVPPMHTLLHPSINVPRTLNSTELPTLNLNILEPSNYTPPATTQHQPTQLFKNYIPPPQEPQIIAVKLHQYDKPPHQNGTLNGTPHQQHHPPQQPTPQPPKQKKRKRPDQNGTTPHDPNQVSSVSSSDSTYKRPSLSVNIKQLNGNGHTNGHEDSLDKPVKKKRKRCGECIGCQRKDNCGECAPCRNDKSHQICKQRRCDKLTEKKTPKSKMKQQPQPHQQQQQNHH